MTATDRMVVVRGPRPGAPDRHRRLFDDAVRALEPLATVDDVDAAQDELAALRSRGAPVDLVVIGPDVPRPFVAGRELRRADETVGLAFVVGAAAADAFDLRLALVPELRGAAVTVGGTSSRELAGALREAAASAARRNQVETTIAAMNRVIAQGAGGQAARSARASVSESYLAALVRHVPDAIVSVDVDRRIVALNEAAVGLLGVAPEQLSGTALHDALDGPADDDLHHLVDQALDGATITGEELELVTEDAGRRLVAATAAPVRDDTGDIVGAVLVVRDITEQHRAEERLRELQKAQSLATLAGGVAHDFNNLLVTIKSWSQIAAEDLRDTATVEHALARIQGAADRAADLARAMLVYSGRGRFQMRAVDLAELVREMITLLRGTINRKTELALELDDVPPVEADPSQLRQVLLNLITNAAEAIGDRTGTITVRTWLDDLPAELADDVLAPDRYVVVEVSDTGPGMDADTLERVFEPFFTTKFEGRGLGLAASHGIVRGHGGALVGESEPGRGATFRVLLPAGDEEAS